MRLSLILPCFNEEQNIERTLRQVFAWFQEDGVSGEVIVVNDGSTDGTKEKLAALAREHAALRIVLHPENRGYGAAVRSGCDAATKEYVAFMDSDGQFDPRDFRKLLPLLLHMDFVTGRRRRRADPWIRKVNAKLFGLLAWLFLGIWVRDINCAMKVFRRSLWSKIRPEQSTGALFNAELFLRLKQHGVPWAQVDVPHYPRKFGRQTGANLRVVLRMFRELLSLRRGA